MNTAQPLSPVEEGELKQFLGECVLNNWTMYSTRPGVAAPVTFQDFINYSTTSKRAFGNVLNKRIKDGEGDIFDASKRVMAGAHLDAVRTLEMIKLIVRREEALALQEDLKAKLDGLEKQQQAMETTQEKRQRLAQEADDIRRQLGLPVSPAAPETATAVAA